MTQPPPDTPLTPAERDALLAPLAGRSLLVGWSGGPDSTALVGLLAAWASKHGAALATATIDHALRDGSGAEAEAVHRAAAALGVPHTILRWEGDKPATGVQAAARDARYALLANEARRIGADTLVTAHTLDDQAETILMRMARGSGLDGLRGMRPLTSRHDLDLARPLLTIPKSRLIATCKAHDWPYISDPLNADPRFARARWRRLMPLLAREGLTPERLARFAERAGAADDAVLNAAQGLLGDAAQTTDAFDIAAFRDQSATLLCRWLVDRLKLTTDRPALARAETMANRLLQAIRIGQPLRATLAGQLLSLDRTGRLTITPEPPRRRGRPHPQS